MLNNNHVTDSYIDIHTHKAYKNDKQVIGVQSFMTGEVPPPDYQGLFSIGIHPWQLMAADPSMLTVIFQNAIEQLKPHAIGEAGIDLSISANIKKQIETFVFQAVESEKKQLPLVIHAVRSYNDLISIRKKHRFSGRWIVHGFRGNSTICRQLISAGIYISFGTALMHPATQLEDAFVDCPVDQLFLETDTVVSPNIMALYEKAAALKQTSTEDLRKIIFANFTACFRIPD